MSGFHPKRLLEGNIPCGRAVGTNLWQHLWEHRNLSMRIPTKAATYSNLIAATIPI
jgi:hypothetical protein